jgi:cytochrome b
MASDTTIAGDRFDSRSVRVWDPLVRIFHWGVVSAVAAAWLLEDSGRLHEVAGYVVLGLVAFRLAWGIVGTRHARFGDFVPTPHRLVAYLKAVAQRRAPRHLGHNPAGGAMIVALLAALLATAGSGWLMTTDAFWGREWVEELHEFLANGILVLIAGHLTGVVVSSLMHRENLVLAMVTGRKRADE